jgi:hypothetical protein
MLCPYRDSNPCRETRSLVAITSELTRFSLFVTVEATQSSITWLAGHLPRMSKWDGPTEILIDETEVKISSERPPRQWKSNMKTCANIITDLINALPGNNYVNTVQHPTIDEAVFSISSAPSNSRNRVLSDQLIGYARVLTIELCFPCGPYRGYITRFPE